MSKKLRKPLSILAIFAVLFTSLLASFAVPLDAQAGTSYQWGNQITDAKLSQWDGKQMSCDAYVRTAINNVYGLDASGAYAVSGIDRWLQSNAKYVGDSNSVIKPGDVIIFLSYSGGYEHCAIAGGKWSNSSYGAGYILHHGGVGSSGSSGTDGTVVYTDKYFSKGSQEWIDSSYTASSWIKRNQLFSQGSGAGDYFKVYRLIEPNGYLNLRKSLSDPHNMQATAPGAQTVSGARYGVYSGSNKVGTLTTGSNGVSNTISLPAGTYTVKEEVAPAGCRIDYTAKTIVVTAGATATVYASDVPTSGSVSLKKKIARDSALVNECIENYSIIGTEYTVYQGSKAVGILKVYNEEGDTNTLYLKPGTYTVQETKCNEGYKIDQNIYSVTLTDGGSQLVTSTEVPKIDPLGLFLTKTPEPGATVGLPLKGAQYRVDYYKAVNADAAVFEGVTPARTWTFETDENGKIDYSDAYKIAGDELFKNDDGRAVAVIGSYVFTEIKAPRGFAATPKPFVMTVTGKANTQKLEYNLPTDVEKEQTVQIDIQKVDADTGKGEAQGTELGGTLAGAKYEVYKRNPENDTEELVGTITTDENGKGSLTGLKEGSYAVREIFAPAGYLLEQKTHIVEARLKALNEPNFVYEVTSKETPITAEVNKVSIDKYGLQYRASGAVLQLKKADGTLLKEWTTTGEYFYIKGIPAGDYIIHEVTPADGCLPLEEDYAFTVEETAHQVFNVFNEPIPLLSTTALFDGNKNHISDGEAVVTDTVSYEKVLAGHEYTVKGQLVDKNTGDVIAEGQTVFTPEEASGSVDVELSFDASLYENGNTFVVYETLYRNDRKGETKVAEHKDLTDEKQTVRIPAIRTTATDTDGEKDALSTEDIRIIDTVSYENLTPGKEYTVKGMLMDKATGKALLDDSGAEVTAESTFVPDSDAGSVAIEFSFSGVTLAGKTIVAFEEIYEDKTLIAVHADIDDTDQSVYIPKIGTTATCRDEKEAINAGEETFVDVVEYENLIPGKTYKVSGSLIRKSDEEVLVTAEKEFMADEASGSVSVEFTIDTSELAGEELVVFEDLYKDGKLVATHADLEDEGQTVRVVKPEIGTTATVDDAKTAHAITEVTIVDRVYYKDLIPGREYTVKGVLMDKETGEPFQVAEAATEEGEDAGDQAADDESQIPGDDADSNNKEATKEITAEATFTAEDKEGYVDVEFTFSGLGLEEKELVVFEDLFFEEKLIAVHADIEDEDQTVRFETPSVKTTATADGGKAVQLGGKIEIKDTVSYEGLVPEKEYTIKGILMDKTTGKPLIVRGKEVTAEKVFTATGEKGETEVIFTFDSAGLPQGDTVVFEELHYKGELIAEHKDIDDKDQTVFLSELPIPKTGDLAKAGLYVAMTFAAAGLVLVVRRKHAKAN